MVADGLPLFHGAQLAIDTTMITAVRGTANPVYCARGWMVQPLHARGAGRRSRTPSFRELTACEVGGRWSEESMSFLSQLAKAKVRHEPLAIRASARHAWLRRWSSILACSASRSFALPCWSCVVGLAQTVPHPRALTW